MEAVLNAHDLSHWAGRRDHALLLALYNTGARVSEITGLQRSQVQFGTKSFVQFKGKGRKERAVPLWSSTSRTLRTWFEELNSDARYRAATAFPKARGAALSRDGVAYILQQAVERSATPCPSVAHKRVTPHLIPHTSAMHLLEAGVDITVIALWLGHESAQTTHGDVEADLAMKEKALEKLAPAGQKPKRFQAADELLRFLRSL
jgi:integrase/recombinase XerD